MFLNMFESATSAYIGKFVKVVLTVYRHNISTWIRVNLLSIQTIIIVWKTRTKLLQTDCHNLNWNVSRYTPHVVFRIFSRFFIACSVKKWWWLPRCNTIILNIPTVDLMTRVRFPPVDENEICTVLYEWNIDFRCE